MNMNKIIACSNYYSTMHDLRSKRYAIQSDLKEQDFQIKQIERLIKLSGPVTNKKRTTFD